MITYDKIMVEPYVSSQKIRPTIHKGFASVDQRGKVVGLKILVKAQIIRGSKLEIIEPGTMAYISEELLHTQLCKHIYECEVIKGQFMLVDLHNIAFIGDGPKIPRKVKN
jgi:hypothetical protein